ALGDLVSDAAQEAGHSVSSLRGAGQRSKSPPSNRSSGWRRGGCPGHRHAWPAPADIGRFDVDSTSIRRTRAGGGREARGWASTAARVLVGAGGPAGASRPAPRSGELGSGDPDGSVVPGVHVGVELDLERVLDLDGGDLVE